MAYKDLEKKYAAIDTHDMQPGGTLHFTAEDVRNDPASVFPKICGLNQKIRPFLQWAGSFFLVPKKVKAVITAYVAAMDVLCEQE